MRSAALRIGGLVFALALGSLEVSAATAPPVVRPQESLEDQVASTRTSLEAFAAVEREASVLRARLEEALRRMDALLRILGQELPQPLEPLVDLPLGTRESLQAEVLRRRAFLGGLRERALALREGSEVSEKAERDAASWPPLERSLRGAAVSALDSIAALRKACAAAKVELDEIDLGLEPSSIDAWVLRCEGVSAPGGPPSELDRDVLDRIEETRAATAAAAPVPSEMFATAEREAQAGEVLEGLVRSSDISDEAIRTQEPALVEAAMDGAITEYRNSTKALAAVLANLGDLRSALELARQEATKRTTPKREDYPGEGGFPQLREAHGHNLHAEAMVRFREEGVSLAERVRAETVALSEALDASSRVFVRQAEATLGLVVHRRVLLDLVEAGRLESYEFPPDISIEEIWRDLLHLVDEEAQRLEESERFKLELNTRDPVASARRELEGQFELARLAREDFEEEQGLAALLEGVRNWSDTELIASLAPQGVITIELAEASALYGENSLRFAELRKNTLGLRSNVEDLDNPYSRLEVTRHPERSDAIRLALDRLASGTEDLPLDSSLDLARQSELRRDVQSLGLLEESGGDQLGPSVEEIAYIESEQRLARDRLRYFDELEELRATFRVGFDQTLAAGEATLEAMGIQRQALRRGLMCALEIRTRISSGRIDTAELPAGLESWSDRDRSAKVQSEIDDFRSAFNQDRRTLRARLDGIELLLAWKRFAELGGLVAQEKVELISKPQRYVEAAERSIEELRDFERQNLEFEGSLRKSAQTPAFVTALSAIAPPRIRTRYDETLDAYCLEVVNLERSLVEFGHASDAYEKLIEVTASHSKELAEGMESLREAEKLAWRRYQLVRHLAAAALNPRRRTAIAANYRKVCGEALPSEDGLPLSSQSLGWATSLVGAESALWGARRWIAALEHRLSRLGFDSEINRYRAHKSRIESEVEERTEQARSLQIRIADLLHDYRQELKRSAGITVARVLLIPFVALLLARLVRRAISRIQERGRGVDDNEERRRRVKTLSNVATASITVAIWILAGIYALAELGLDVTPIVASASVAGLALAFGAQALVRDYFAGFCILYENQYTVGDVVDVGSAAGTVEHITLRVTVLRDIQGGVHYVPNGLIQCVSNKTKGWSRVVLEVAVPYGEDLDRVTDVLRSVLKEIKEAPEWGRLILEDPFVAGVELLGESSINVRLMVKTLPGEQWSVARELRRRVRMRFDREGIRAPLPHRIVHHLKGDEETSTGRGAIKGAGEAPP